MSSSELIEKLKVSLEAATYSFDGRQTMRAAIAEYEAALSQQEAEPVAERFNECVHGVTFNSECEQCSAECAAGLPPQSQKVRIDMGAAVMDRLIHVGYTNAEQIEYVKDESEGEGAFYSDTEDDCVIPLYMLKVHAHRLGYPVAESSPSKPAALPQPVAMSIPEDCPHLIFFDDNDLESEIFLGCGARDGARARYEQISLNWNAHLFACIDHNSRDCEYSVAQIVQQPVASVPQDVEEFISEKAIHVSLLRECMTVSIDDLRTFLSQRDAESVLKIDIEKALQRAFSLGQIYWQQADSEYPSQHRKSIETMEKFKALLTASKEGKV